ncbi:MAG: FliM/FliN family flagellar motor switch protein [Planctomycetota bacterium]
MGDEIPDSPPPQGEEPKADHTETPPAEGEVDPLSRLLAEMDEHGGADMAPVLTQSVPSIPVAEEAVSQELASILSEPEPLVSDQVAASSGSSKVDMLAASEELQRILRLKVPFQVMLAEKRERFSDVIAFQIGTLIEFSKLSDELLEVQVNEQPIGYGEVVKVQEKFGVRIKSMADTSTRIRSLAK